MDFLEWMSSWIPSYFRSQSTNNENDSAPSCVLAHLWVAFWSVAYIVSISCLPFEAKALTSALVYLLLGGNLILDKVNQVVSCAFVLLTVVPWLLATYWSFRLNKIIEEPGSASQMKSVCKQYKKRIYRLCCCQILICLFFVVSFYFWNKMD